MERTGSRISLPGKRKEVSPGLDNALCRETRFRRTTSSVKPIIGGYHSSLVYINVACDRSPRISEIIGDVRTLEWLARLIQILFFDIFADTWFAGKYLYSIFFLKPHAALNLEKNIVIHKETLEILSSETL